MGTINFSGLASGLDSANIIKAMMEAAHIPIDQIRAKEDLLHVHQGIFNKVSSLLQDLGKNCLGMKSAGQFMQLRATASNPGVVNATAGTGVTAGRYSIAVQTLAQAQKTYSDAISSASDGGLFGTGTISVQVGQGSALDVHVDATTSLQDVASAINGANIGASASIVFDGTSYRMEVSGNETGAANAITFTENGTSLGMSQAANTVQSAQDASILIDNLVTVTSASNTVSGAIAGVTLQLSGTSPAAQTITVAPDDAAITDAVSKFVEAYNGVMAEINADAKYGGHVDPTKLVGDPTLQNLVRQMQSIITSPMDGLTGSFRALSQIGIATQADGTLALDEKIFQAALAQDPDGVAQLFTGGPNGTSPGISTAMSKLSDGYAMPGLGILPLISSSMDTQARDMEMHIAGMEDNLQAYEQTLQAQFYQLEQLVSKLKSQGQFLDRQLNNNNGK